jgi:cytoskeletal protein CcmA (bactofilin family)
MGFWNNKRKDASDSDELTSQFQSKSQSSGLLADQIKGVLSEAGHNAASKAALSQKFDPAKKIPPSRSRLAVTSGERISGELYFEEPVRIDGALVDADLNSISTITLSEGSLVTTSKLSAEKIEINGAVTNSRCHANQLIKLDKKANFNGSLSTTNLVMEDGAILDGELFIGHTSKF